MRKFPESWGGAVAFVVAVAGAGVMAACDPPEPPELTEAEAVGMLRSVIGVMDDAEVFGAGSMDTVFCPEGGTAAVEVISYLEHEGGDTVRYDDMVSIKPSACEMTLAGSTFTVDGAPDVRFHIEGWILDSDDFSLEWRMFGALAWEKGSEGGARCEVSLGSRDVSLNDLDGSIALTFHGGLCGLDVTVDWEFG